MSDALPPPPPLSKLAAAGPVALFLDFDGTLVEIAATYDAIAVPEGLGRRLERLSAAHGDRMALVSGRSLHDLDGHLGRVEVAMAGSHGAERRRMDGGPLGDRPRGVPDDVRAALRAFADDNSGIRVEEKSFGAALHFRDVPELEQKADARMDELAQDHDLAIKRGKAVIELVAPGSTKGAAVEVFMAKDRFVGARPVFIGDDVTDEDGFAVVVAMGGIAIAVGERASANATHHLADPTAVHQWLEL